MSKQVLVIHGGNVFETYEEYISYLQNKELTLEKVTIQDWKRNLQVSLGDEYQVVAPLMPNSQNARYAEWKIWFEKITPLLNQDVVLIGHSLGGIFLAKYLAENKYPKRVRATFLVAAPYMPDPGETLGDFELPDSLQGVAEQSGALFLYQSKDDPVVPWEHVERYRAVLPGAVVRIFEGRQHFNQRELPEIVQDIQSLKW